MAYRVFHPAEGRRGARIGVEVVQGRGVAGSVEGLAGRRERQLRRQLYADRRSHQSYIAWFSP